jgi:hypothetical protein
MITILDPIFIKKSCFELSEVYKRWSVPEKNIGLELNTLEYIPCPKNTSFLTH